MTIEQHAEAAAEKIVERYDEPHFDFVYEIIAKHMQAAIDEATAPLRARIAELEGLGPLIEEYERDVFDAVLSGRDVDTDPACAVTGSQIERILKGGAS